MTRNPYWLAMRCALAVLVMCLGAGRVPGQPADPPWVVVRTDAGNGYMDRSGKMVIPPAFRLCENFRCGRALVSAEAEGRQLWGYIDSTGSFCIEPRYQQAVGFQDGIAAVKSGPAWHGIDLAGRKLFEFPAGITFARPGYSNATFWVCLSNRWGLVSSRGTWVKPPAFDAVGDYAEGLAAVEIDDRWGYVGVDGELRIHPGYQFAEPMSAGVAVVKDQLGDWGYVRRDGSPAFGKYTMCLSFREGVAAVKLELLWGFLDTNGVFVIKPQFLEADSFSCGRAAVRVGRRWGYIDRIGAVKIPPVFGMVHRFQSDLAEVYLEAPGLFTVVPARYIDTNGLTIWPKTGTGGGQQ